MAWGWGSPAGALAGASGLGLLARWPGRGGGQFKSVGMRSEREGKERERVCELSESSRDKRIGAVSGVRRNGLGKRSRDDQNNHRMGTWESQRAREREQEKI